MKSRGRGLIEGAAGPLPRPSGPWQVWQRCKKMRCPSGSSGFASTPGGQAIEANSAGSGRQRERGCANPARAQSERPASKRRQDQHGGDDDAPASHGVVYYPVV